MDMECMDDYDPLEIRIKTEPELDIPPDDPGPQIHFCDVNKPSTQFEPNVTIKKEERPDKEEGPDEEERSDEEEEDESVLNLVPPVVEMTVGDSAWTDKPAEPKENNLTVSRIVEVVSNHHSITSDPAAPELGPKVKPKRIYPAKRALITNPDNEEFSRLINANLRDTQHKRVKLECDICSDQYRYRAELFRHMHAQHIKKATTCNRCGEAFKRHTDLRVHMRKYPPDPFACEFCGAVFLLKVNLTNHLRIHTGERPYECEFCQMRFQKSYPMKVHIRMVHTFEKPFVCDKCKAAFVTQTRLNNHLKLVHSDQPRERSFKCADCEQAFFDMATLQDHIRTHTGEKPFVCEFCHRAFAQRYGLRAHRNIHTGERPCKCRHCERGFHSSAARRWHEKVVHKDPKIETNRTQFAKNKNKKATLPLEGTE